MLLMAMTLHQPTSKSTCYYPKQLS